MSRNFFWTEMMNETLASKVDVEWSDVDLYTPYYKHQALTYECADCLATQAFLKMAGLPIRVQERPNAEFMSPSGKVPFLKVQEILVADFEHIVDFVAKRGIRLSAGLTDVQRADMTAHIAMIEQILRNVQIYLLWNNDIVYNRVTRDRYASVYLWPLNILLPKFKRRDILRYLRAIDWYDKSLEWVIEAADRCFKSLSSRLHTNQYFMGDSPTELDALAFGHLFTIFCTELPETEVTNCLRKYPNLIEFINRVDQQFR